MISVALDAMGGDLGLQATVAAAARISLAQRVRVVLVGDASGIQAALRNHRHDISFLSIHHAGQAIDMAEKPREAVEAKPDASILVAARLVAQGQADALVSAGNTGASILACARHFQKLPGVPRTALAAVVPTERRRGPHDDPFSLLLDVGATLSADADALVAFAHMGAAYSSRISRQARPTVALLSNGEEAYKGTPAIVEAHERLRSDHRINFIGNVEGIDLPRGKADVVVTDGFTGNVVLKMIEGISEAVVDLAKFAYRSKLIWRAGLFMLSSGIRQLKQITDWRQYGGAPILGFDHPFIKAHGRSGDLAIANAIKVAAKTVKSDLCAEIQRSLAPPSGGGT